MQTDYVQRFLFENLDIRGRLVCLTGAWQRMLDGRGYPEHIAALLGHTTALNVLLGANQKGAGRVTLQVQGSGPVKLLVADCTAELRIRGMAASRSKKRSPRANRAAPAGRRPPVGDARGPEERPVLPEPGAARRRHAWSRSSSTTCRSPSSRPPSCACTPTAARSAACCWRSCRKADERDPDGWNRVTPPRRHPAARRDARRPALRPPDARVPRGADARVPPLRGRVPLPLRRGQGEGHAARPGPRARSNRSSPSRARW